MVFKLREPHFEKIVIPKNAMMIKFGVETDELQKLIRKNRAKHKR